MSFGWSVGDVISGLKAVWDIWQAVSDGPLNARFEASQFFDEYVLIMSRLEKWENRKTAFSQDELLAKSQRQLREQCTLFLKSHIKLIQQANPGTIAKREGRSTWLKKAPFSKDQVLALYQQVQWPLEREAVAKLRIKLHFFLDVASFDVALDTNGTLHQMRHVAFHPFHSPADNLVEPRMLTLCPQTSNWSLLTWNWCHLSKTTSDASPILLSLGVKQRRLTIPCYGSSTRHSEFRRHYQGLNQCSRSKRAMLDPLFHGNKILENLILNTP